MPGWTRSSTASSWPALSSGCRRRTRTVLVETFYRGSTLTTLARQLAVPPGTVRSRLHYALHALRQYPDDPRKRPRPDEEPPAQDPPIDADRGGAAGDRHGLLLVTVLLAAAATGLEPLLHRRGSSPARPAGRRAGRGRPGLGRTEPGRCARVSPGPGLGQLGRVLIGITSAPQAAATGFRALYAVPNTATAVVGILLTVSVLATAGLARPAGQVPGMPRGRRAIRRGCATPGGTTPGSGRLALQLGLRLLRHCLVQRAALVSTCAPFPWPVLACSAAAPATERWARSGAGSARMPCAAGGAGPGSGRRSPARGPSPRERVRWRSAAAARSR